MEGATAVQSYIIVIPTSFIITVIYVSYFSNTSTVVNTKSGPRPLAYCLPNSEAIHSMNGVTRCWSGVAVEGLGADIY
jgi:hypothetical protein